MVGVFMVWLHPFLHWPFPEEAGRERSAEIATIDMLSINIPLIQIVSRAASNPALFASHSSINFSIQYYTSSCEAHR